MNIRGVVWFSLLAPAASCCPLCNTPDAAAVRALLARDTGFNVLTACAPFVLSLLLAGVLHFGVPFTTSRGRAEKSK